MSPPNTLLTNCNHKDFLAEFHAISDISTSFEWPKFTEFLNNKSDVGTALTHEFIATIGGIDYTALLEETGADRLSIPYQLIDRRQVEIATDNGFNVQVWTTNTELLLKNYCNWPVEYILTDFPELAPCL